MPVFSQMNFQASFVSWERLTMFKSQKGFSYLTLSGMHPDEPKLLFLVKAKQSNSRVLDVLYPP